MSRPPARRLNHNNIFVGAGFLSIGTDLPEIAITVDISMQSFLGSATSGSALGNTVGSAIGQVSLVMGLVGLLGGLKASHGTLNCMDPA